MVEAEQRLRTVKKVMVVQQHHVLQISSGKCDIRDLGRNKGAKTTSITNCRVRFLTLTGVSSCFRSFPASSVYRQCVVMGAMWDV